MRSKSLPVLVMLGLVVVALLFAFSSIVGNPFKLFQETPTDGSNPSSGGGSGADSSSPSVPENLIATQDATFIRLDWEPSSDNVGVAGYELFRSFFPDQSFNAVDSVPTTSFLDESVSAGTTYYYQVRSFDAAGNRGDFSNPVGMVANQAPSIYAPSVSYRPADKNDFFELNMIATAGDPDGKIDLIWWSKTSAPAGCSFVRQADSGIGTVLASSTASYQCPVGNYWVFYNAQDEDGAWSQGEARFRVFSP